MKTPIRSTLLLLVGIAIGLWTVDLAAQLMVLTDGTTASKVVLYNSAGVAQSVGGGTQYNEDDAATNGATGTAVLAIQNASPANTAGANDWSNLQMSAGRLWVDASGVTLTVSDGAGAMNVICDSGCSGGTQYTEDAAAAADPVGSAVNLVRKDTPSATTTTDGDNIAQRGTDYGAAYVTLLNPSGVSVTGATAYLSVRVTDGTTFLSNSDLTDDTAYTWTSVAGPGVMARASAAAPTDVSADNDAVAPWALRSGALAVQLTSSGTLLSPASLGVYVEDAAETAGGNLMMAGAVRRDTAASSSGTTGDNSTINTDVIGQLWTRNLDPCNGVAKIYVPISLASASAQVEIAASASNKAYVCSLDLVVAGANNVALLEDATGSCASPDAGMAGGTTAATGWNFAANGGLAIGNGNATVFKSASTNVNVCLLASATTQISGSLSYVLAP